MRKGRRRRYWPWRSGAGALAAGLLSGTNGAIAQPPYLPTAPAPVVQGPYIAGDREPLGKRLNDTFIGRHDMFYEPPPGYFARNTFGMMKAKADPHRFTPLSHRLPPRHDTPVASGRHPLQPDREPAPRLARAGGHRVEPR